MWFYFISTHAPVIWRKSFLIVVSLPSDVQCYGCDSLVLSFCSNLILLDTTDVSHMIISVPSCVISCFPVCQLLQVSPAWWFFRFLRVWYRDFRFAIFSKYRFYVLFRVCISCLARLLEQCFVWNILKLFYINNQY